MKKILTLLALMSAVLASCTKSGLNESNGNNGNPQDEPVYEISVSPASLTFGAEGGEQSVTVTSSDDWYLDGKSEWCKVSQSYGSNGAKVTFTADPYTNTEEARTAIYTFCCGDKEVELTVKQEAKVYSISVEPKELPFEVEGGEKEITITSSDGWTVREVPEWITVSKRRGANEEAVTVKVEYNAEASIRSGNILFVCGNKDAKVTVTQQADDSPIIQFKDDYFRQALLKKVDVIWNGVEYRVVVDKNGDKQISEKEAASVNILYIANYHDENIPVRNIDEISYFTSLEYLDCYGNQLTSLDVSACTALTVLRCSGNQLTSLDVSACTALTELSCNGNRLTSLDVSGCTSLTYLHCGGNQLTSLDVSGYTSLTYLNCVGGQLTSLDVSGCTALTVLWCLETQLTSLDVSGCTALTELLCWGNRLTSLDVSACTALTELSCSGNQLTSLDVSACTALTELSCDENQLTSLDVNKNTALTSLYCYSNPLTSLDVRGCRVLNNLRCVFYYSDNDDIDWETKCPLKSLVLYKYHMLTETNLSVLKEVYRSIISYAE